MATIYHITTATEWNDAKTRGFYEAPSLKAEGFIHCSEAGQVAGVLQRYYTGQTGLVKLHIDTNKLEAPLKYEVAPSINEPFPHVYGLINTDAVVDVEDVAGA